MAQRPALMDRTPSVFEIQAGEGGEDSKLFALDLTNAYIKYARKKQLLVELILEARGKYALHITGPLAFERFKLEGGKHTVQRVPPTERHSRRQSSSISVAVSPIKDNLMVKPLKDNEIRIETKRGSGPGGQHRNKTESAVRMTHVPTGLSVTIDSRDQHANKRLALKILTSKVFDIELSKQHTEFSSIKKVQFGGMGRSDKIRTYNFIDNRATDHRSNIKTSKLAEIMNGQFDIFYNNKEE